MKSKIIGTEARTKTVGAAIKEESETLCFKKKTRKKVAQPKTAMIGEKKRTYPAKQATHFPPLK